MLFRMKDLIGLKVLAQGEPVGKTRDLYFDDRSWDVRYLIVSTGGWLHHKEVLLRPKCFTKFDDSMLEFRTTLSKAQVEESPPLDTALPVSRQYEETLHAYYDWDPYWSSPLYAMPGMYFYPSELEAREERLHQAQERPREEFGDDFAPLSEQPSAHLRSFTEVRDYEVQATDGEVGHVSDLLLDAETWHLTHVLVNAHRWLPGRHVVIDLGAARGIDWASRTMAFNLTKAEIKAAPEYVGTAIIEPAFQRRISQYYRRISGNEPRPYSGEWPV